MGRTMARRGTGAPLMKMMGLLEDLSEDEDEVLAGGGVAVELGMMPLVPVPEDDPDPDPELEPDTELVDDGLRMPDKNLEPAGGLGKPGRPGGPGGLGVGCEGPVGRLRDGKVGEAPDFRPSPSRLRTSSRARRDGGLGGSIVEMRLAIPCRLDTRSLAQTSSRVRGGKADDDYLLRG